MLINPAKAKKLLAEAGYPARIQDQRRGHGGRGPGITEIVLAYWAAIGIERKSG